MYRKMIGRNCKAGKEARIRARYRIKGIILAFHRKVMINWPRTV
jgi:hypothetical protein